MCPRLVPSMDLAGHGERVMVYLMVGLLIVFLILMVIVLLFESWVCLWLMLIVGCVIEVLPDPDRTDQHLNGGVHVTVDMKVDVE